MYILPFLYFFFHLHAAAQRKKMDAIIVSWNILNQQTLSKDMTLHLGSWEERKKTINAYLLSAPFDYILLQEVELDTFELDFALLFENFVYFRHERTKQRTNHFGNVILWRNNASLLSSKANTKSIHVQLQLKNKTQIWISNVHFPAKPGLEGYKEKLHHLKSCGYGKKM